MLFVNICFRLQDYESCKTYAQEINQQINNFRRLPNGSAQRGKVISSIEFKRKTKENRRFLGFSNDSIDVQ